MGVQLSRIEATLAHLVKTIEEVKQTGSPPDDVALLEKSIHSVSAKSADDRVRVAATWAQATARRDKLFGGDLFSDPAWAILLNLYLAGRRHSDLCISSICNSSGIAMTTALRWLQVLQDLSLLERHADPFDKRRALLRLSQTGVSKVEEALDLAVDSGRQHKLGELCTRDRS